MLECDFGARMQSSRWMQNKQNHDLHVFSHILFIDEAIFTRHGSVNMHNSLITSNMLVAIRMSQNRLNVSKGLV